jgi:integrase
MKATNAKKSATRRARGSGSIFFNEARQRWIGRKVVGHTSTGKPVVEEVWGKKQSDVVKALEAVGPPDADTTVAAWAVRWLKSISVRPSTMENYSSSLDNHILPTIGHLRVVDVKPSRFETLAVDLQKDLEVGTVLKVLATARGLFGAAVREELISRNPVSIARRPRAVHKKLLPFTPAELLRIIHSGTGFSSGPLIALLAASGCRLGEALALDIADWNEKTGTITITKTYSKRYGIGPPKSVHSRRTITVPAVVRPLLVEAAGTRVNAPLFVTEMNKRIIPSLIQRAFKRLLGRMKISYRKVHQMRHSVATALISAGVPLGDVAKYLGDSVATVVKTYVHPSGANPGVELDRILNTPANNLAESV